jgi:diacylglycerol kinase family enzyme
MVTGSPCCLISNARSGSNDAAALAALRAQCKTAGLAVRREIAFPDDPLPCPQDLDDAGIVLVVIFTGDGTLNTALDRLAGWGGQVLVLPGGTQNLFAKRLHGDGPPGAVLAAHAAGRLVAYRPQVIRCPLGHAYAELQAGPGTAWQRVREAMRDGSVLGLAQEGVAAIAATFTVPGVVCQSPQLGRPEGYPLIVLTAHDAGIAVTAFHADTAGDVMAQAAALSEGNFREGPHAKLGMARAVTLAATDAAPFGLLLDGEPAVPGATCTFALVAAPVDLLASRTNG